jgi:hypothetical protein
LFLSLASICWFNKQYIRNQLNALVLMLMFAEFICAPPIFLDIWSNGKHGMFSCLCFRFVSLMMKLIAYIKALDCKVQRLCTLISDWVKGKLCEKKWARTKLIKDDLRQFFSQIESCCRIKQVRARADYNEVDFDSVCGYQCL